ncbi:MAG: NusG domain II-containing protein [Candidatus Latescibacteria bacterium]|nr:NusG domain II-containing protein [Candidatus Latescibacterota bacterium]
MSSEEASASPRQAPTPADLILALLLVAGSLGLWVFTGRRPPGSEVVMESDDRRQRCPLNRDQVLYLDGPLGRSRVEIAGQGARIATSPCPEQRCVLQGWIRRQGEVAACLPNHLVLRIEGGSETVDALSR